MLTLIWHSCASAEYSGAILNFFLLQIVVKHCVYRRQTIRLFISKKKLFRKTC